jgi:hypothetical protein
VQACTLRGLLPSARVAEVRVSAVDDDVTRCQERPQLVDDPIDRLSGRHQQDNPARRLQRPDQLRGRARYGGSG